MPRLIDYVGRFEFIRQAAFAVVRDEGADALSRRRVAAELGTGVNTIRRSVADWADLARLAADQVRSRRRVGRPVRGSLETVEHLVGSLMPEDASHLDEELVWLKLLAACALRPSGLEPPGQLKHEFGIAQRGHDVGLLVRDEPAGARTPGREDRRTALESYVADRDDELTAVIDQALDLLTVPEPRADVVSTMIAVVEGLTLSACLGRITPERATELAIGYARSLAPPDSTIRRPPEEQPGEQPVEQPEGEPGEQPAPVSVNE